MTPMIPTFEAFALVWQAGCEYTTSTVLAHRIMCGTQRTMCSVEFAHSVRLPMFVVASADSEVAFAHGSMLAGPPGQGSAAIRALYSSVRRGRSSFTRVFFVQILIFNVMFVQVLVLAPLLVSTRAVAAKRSERRRNIFAFLGIFVCTVAYVTAD